MTEIKIEKNEFWWGGTTMHGYCPLNARSDYHQDFRKYAPNQTMPFFVSSLGRYIWSEEPFKIDIENGKIIIDGENIILEKAGSTLKEAYLEAQKKHFSCDGVKLEKKFFEIPQYNSWIEFTYYSTQNGILEYAHNIIKNGFEPGVLIIDEGWHINTGYGNWEFDFARFPDPKAMVDELHSLGFVVMLWITPFVSPVGPGYVRSLNAFIGTDPESANHIYKRNENNEIAMTKWWNGISAILDLTNKYDADFLDKQLQHLIIDYGVDGFKFDGGALHHYSDDNIINGSFAKGHSPAECNIAWNEFGRKYRYHEYKDTFKGGGKNVIQRLHDRDHSWTGNGLSDIIPCAITNGLIGHPFICPDMVGGGEWRNRYTPGFITDEELFVRMAQCSALFPMIQFSWAPWEALSEENLRICVEAARLHSSMSKEILALVESAEETGEPIIRCLEYNDPMQGYEEINDEFMLGEDILVAPVMEKGAEERTVVFPEGMWQDTDGKIYEGRNSFAVSAPLNKLPWFRRINNKEWKTMKKLRFGIVGTGNIAHRFAQAIKNVEEAELVAVASRKQETADAFADEFDIPQRFCSYEAMAKSDAIDFAYIALPHSYHCEASCLMMNNGKNVICEKPMAVNEKQGIEMFECAEKNNVFLMEAMWARLVPGTIKLLSLVSDGIIGNLHGVEGKFCYTMDEDEMGHHVFKNENGGGSLLDVGVYGLAFARWYLGEKVTDVSAYAEMFRNTDSHLCALLKYESGAIAEISSATLLRKPNEGYLYGEKGYIHINRFYAPQKLEIHLNDGREEIIETPYKGNGFEEQIAHVCECVNNGLKESPVNTPESTLYVLRQMDEIRKKIGLAYPQD